MHARINLAVLKLVHILWWKLIVKFLRSTDMYVADLVQGRYVRVRSFRSDHLTICGLWQGFALLPRGWGGEGGGVLHKVLYGKAPPGGSFLTLLHIIFTVKVPVLYTFY